MYINQFVNFMSVDLIDLFSWPLPPRRLVLPAGNRLRCQQLSIHRAACENSVSKIALKTAKCIVAVKRTIQCSVSFYNEEIEPFTKLGA